MSLGCCWQIESKRQGVQALSCDVSADGLAHVWHVLLQSSTCIQTFDPKFAPNLSRLAVPSCQNLSLSTFSMPWRHMGHCIGGRAAQVEQVRTQCQTALAAKHKHLELKPTPWNNPVSSALPALTSLLAAWMLRQHCSHSTT